MPTVPQVASPQQITKSEELWEQLIKLWQIEERLEKLITRIRGSERPTEPTAETAPPLPTGTLHSLLTHGVHYTEQVGKIIHTRINEIEELLF